MNAVKLRTEYLKNPMGIDITQPRLFWNCEGGTAAGSANAGALRRHAAEQPHPGELAGAAVG